MSNCLPPEPSVRTSGSYPNYVPLSAAVVDQIVRAVEPFEYERVYGAFWDTVIERAGKAAVNRSAQRYRRAISGE